MKKENTQAAIAKRKKTIKIICYISLVVLNILLFLPVALRLFIKDKDLDEEVKPKDVVVVLACNKVDESISATFLNDAPQNILYNLKGDRTVVTNPDEEEFVEDDLEGQDFDDDETIDDDDEPQDDNNQTSDNDNESQIDNNKLIDIGNNKNSMFDLIRLYSNVSYNESEDITSVRANVADLQGLPEYERYFSSVAAQTAYYESQGFFCTKSEL